MISHYQVLKELSHGGMGNVFLAQDTRLPRKVALKLIRNELQQDPAVREQFMQEAVSAATIDHPYICTIYETGEFKGEVFIAMEYLEGQVLRKRLEQGTFPLKKSLRLAVEISEALEEIHRMEIIHQDLNPNNIMLIRQDHVKIMDFGLAQRYATFQEAGQDDFTVSRQNVIAGTLPYMSPEQICGERPDPRSDIFSFGVVLYEMITGIHPFRKTDGHKTAHAILESDPAPLYRSEREIPELLQHTINRMLAKDPENRFQSVREIRTNLELILEDLDTASSNHRDRPTIAVLPFVDMSPDKDQDYLCEGLAEELINALTKLENLRVAARTSAFRFKNTGQDLREIGRLLRVRSILEGSVQKSGNNLRIGVRLTNVDDGYEIWSQRFDCTLDDIFSIQDEISRAVVEKLNISFSPSSPTNGKAYESYLKGRFCWNMRTEEGIVKSMQYFQQAIQQDPEYALAWSGLAASRVTAGIYGIESPEEAMREAKNAVSMALDLNPRLPTALASLGSIRAMYDWEWSEADTDFKIAIEIEPRNETVHHWYAINYLTPLGRFDEARSEIETARKIDPLNMVIHASLGLRHYYERRYDQAILEYAKILEMDRNFSLGRYFLGKAYVQKGMFHEAIASLEQAAALNSGSPEIKAALGHACALAGKKSRAIALLRQLIDRSEDRYISPVLPALIHIGLRDKQKAFTYLEKAFRSRATDLVWLKVRPDFDPIRSDPGFTELCEKIGLL